MQCQREDVFHCNGRPSLCYRHDGDGDCEDFERKTSIKDCGFYTPDGFKDQWVHSAKANPKYILHNEYCPADVVIGEPRPDLVGMAMRVSIYSRILTLHCTRTPEPHQITPEHPHHTTPNLVPMSHTTAHHLDFPYILLMLMKFMVFPRNVPTHEESVLTRGTRQK